MTRGKGRALVAEVRGSLRAILGPCPCGRCGEHIYLARSVTRERNVVVPGPLRWRERTGRVHGCVIAAILR